MQLPSIVDKSEVSESAATAEQISTPQASRKSRASTPIVSKSPKIFKKSMTPELIAEEFEETPNTRKSKLAPIAEITPKSQITLTPKMKKTPQHTPTVAQNNPPSNKKTPVGTPIGQKSTPVVSQSKNTPKSAKTPSQVKNSPLSTPKLMATSVFTPTGKKSTPIIIEKPLSAKKTPTTPKNTNIAEKSPFKKTPKSTPKMTEKSPFKQSTPLTTPKVEKPLSAKKTPQDKKSTPKMTLVEAEDTEQAAPVTKKGRRSVVDMKTPSPRRTRSGKVLNKSPLKAMKESQLQAMPEEGVLTPARRSSRKSIATMKVKSPMTPKTPKRFSLTAAPRSARK